MILPKIFNYKKGNFSVVVYYPLGEEQKMKKVDIVSAKRTPIGKYLGSLKYVTPIELGSTVMRTAVKEANLDPSDLDFYIMGNTLSAGLGQNPSRIAALNAGIPPHIGGFTIDHVCASGLTSVILGGQRILSGRADIVLSGGMESMSRARFSLPPSLRWGVPFNPTSPEAFGTEDLLVKDALWDVPNTSVMGGEADNTARAHGVTREESDKFAYNSHMKAAKATKQGDFEEEIVPVIKGGDVLLREDEGIREDTSMDALAKLPTVFSKDGITTAGSASQLSDCASAVVLMSTRKRKELGLTSLGTIIDWDSTFIEPENFIAAPVPSVRNLLKKTGKEIKEIALFEHNEAFACASVLVRSELEIEPSKFNVRGGAVALGHPIGASGARILTTLVHTMKDEGKANGIATICHGGGGAVSVLVERGD